MALATACGGLVSLMGFPSHTEFRQTLLPFPLSKSRTPTIRRSAGVQVLWWGMQKPEKVELEPITTEDQFNEVLSQCQQSNKGVVIEWMASWCRKCIYLKPKLEKLGAEYYPNYQFYYVDVNTVPKALIERAEVTKMPTIQLWRNGQKKGEVVGGHQAWLVLDEIRDMLKKN